MTKRNRYIAPRIGKDISLENAIRLIELGSKSLGLSAREVGAALLYDDDPAPGVPDEFVFNRALQGEVARVLEARKKAIRVPGVASIDKKGMQGFSRLNAPELAELTRALWDGEHALHRMAYLYAVAILRFLGRWQGERA